MQLRRLIRRVRPPAPHDAGLMVEGRPLRGRNGRVQRAQARRGHSHLTDRQAMHLRHEVRHALAEHWKAQGELEHSSVVAYQDLARRLALLDAPDDLVRRSLSAAVQEADHWTRCFELAGRYLGQSLRPGRLRRPRRLPRSRTAELTSLAVESLRDGMLLEGYAATMATARAERASDRRVVETLRVIAADEVLHAALSADVLSWCVREGGAPVAEIVAAAAAQLPDHPPVLVAPIGLDAPSLAEHGLFDADPTHAAWHAMVESVRTQVCARLSALDTQAAA
jgi:hypothetical protein